MRAACWMILFATTLGASLGIGLAVPAPLAAQALERLEAALEGNPAAPAEPGYLGVITDDREDRGFGVRVMEVIPGGPALAAGVQEDDLIVAANGVQVRSMDDLAAIVQKTPAGGRIAFDLLRERQMVQATVTLGKRPAPGERRFEQFGPIPNEGPTPKQGSAPQAPAAPAEQGPSGNQADEQPGQGGAAREPLGITVGPATAEDRQRLNLGFVQGVLVVDVVAGSAAAQGGILPDDLILSIGGVAVTSADDIAAQLNRISGDKVGVVVLRQGRPVELLLRWPGSQAPAGQPPAPQGPAAPGQPPRPEPPPQVERADSQAARIQALEQRVAELEAKLQALQQRLDQQQ